MSRALAFWMVLAVSFPTSAMAQETFDARAEFAMGREAFEQGRFDEALLIMGTLPFALTGGFWLLYLMGYNQSVATAVGFIALAGVSAEFGVVMLIYLKAALEERPPNPSEDEVDQAIREGALLRVRPKAMTVAVILAGLFPILIGTGAGSEVMSRIAAPMIGGMITAPLLSMFVLPAAYLLMRRPRTKRSKPSEGEEECVLQPS